VARQTEVGGRQNAGEAIYWPLNTIVRLQLCLAAVWGTIVFGVFLLLPVEALALLLADWRPDADQSPLLLTAGILPGGFLAARTLARVWPAARRLRQGWVSTASILGALVFQGLAVTLHRTGIAPDQGSVDPVAQFAVILASTVAGAVTVYCVLRLSCRQVWLSGSEGGAG
jgi:hypothetical protein